MVEPANISRHVVRFGELHHGIKVDADGCSAFQCGLHLVFAVEIGLFNDPLNLSREVSPRIAPRRVPVLPDDVENLHNRVKRRHVKGCGL